MYVKDSNNKNIVIGIIVALVLSIISLMIFWSIDAKSIGGEVSKISIVGEYKISGESKIYKIDNNKSVDLKHNDSLTIKGHFDKPIDINKMVVMRLDNIRIKIYSNDELIYSNENISNSISRSTGNGWQSFISPGITEKDDIVIEFSSVYSNHSSIVFKQFLNNIYAGSDGLLYLKQIRSRLPNYILTFFTICMGIIILIFSLALIKSNQYMPKLICFGGMTISAGIWIFIDFNVQNLFFDKPLFNNSLDIISMLFMMALICLYFSMNMISAWGEIIKSISWVCIVLSLISTITQLLGIADYYDYVNVIQLISFFIGVTILIGITYEYRLKEKKFNRSFLISTYILIMGIVIDSLFSIMQIAPFAIWVKISFIIFISMQLVDVYRSARIFVEENKRVNLLEKMAYRDVHTQLYNKAAYVKKIEKIDKKMRSKSKYNLTVIVFDINYLKDTNDNYGHSKGDELIKICADSISSYFGANNCYRIGGDEFVVIIENTSSIEINVRLMEFEKNTTEKYRTITDIDASIAYGICTFDRDNHKNYEDVFKKADEAMYKKKKIMKHQRCKSTI